MRLLKTTMIGLGVAVLCVTAGATRSEAAMITMTHGNSVIHVDTSSQSGVYDWLVDGQDQLFQQWFWYRVGIVGPESSLDTLSGDLDSDSPYLAGNRGLFVSRGSSSGLAIEVNYLLTGGSVGSQSAMLAEEITIQNNSEATMDLHFFQYSDFDLSATSLNDSVVFLGAGANTVRQSDPLGGDATETVVTPGPSHYEANTFPNTLTSLNDGVATTLGDVVSAGPGDVTWAYQWDFTLNPGASIGISKNKRLGPAPEPASLVLFGFGLIGAAGAARRRKAMAPQA